MKIFIIKKSYRSDKEAQLYNLEQIGAIFNKIGGCGMNNQSLHRLIQLCTSLHLQQYYLNNVVLFIFICSDKLGQFLSNLLNIEAYQAQLSLFRHTFMHVHQYFTGNILRSKTIQL